MATTIDHKIVEMKFDNRDFERNAKTSISTLEKLKSALHIKGSYEGLEKVSKAAKNTNVDVSGITSSLVTVTNSFSALEIVGIRTLVRLTDAAIDAGISIAKSMTVDQFAEGWKKMNQKVGSVQTLVNSTGLSIKEIDEYLSQLMWFSDETSYSFTDMTSALAQMTSTGGDIKKLVPMITGIANATAFAGKGAAEFSRVIYNLNQSYGAGYLQLMDWKSVQLAGANSKQLTEELIRAGEELGKIEKGTVTVGNFNDTLKHKWADTEVMELAFGRFAKLSEAAYQAVKEGKYDTASEAIQALAKDYDNLSVKAFRSAQEAKSFKAAIDATADASSTTWMRIFSDIFGNYEQQKIMWTDFANTLWDTVVQPINDLEEIIRHAFNFEGFSALWDKISNNPVVDVMEDISDKVKSTTRTLEEYQDIVYKVWMGDYKNQPYRFPLLEEAGWNAQVVQELVNETEKISGYGKGYTVIDQITIDSVRKAEEKYGIAISEVVEVQEEQNELTKEQIDDIENLSEERLKALGLSEEEIRMYQSLQRAAKKYGLSINEIIDKMKMQMVMIYYLVELL